MRALPKFRSVLAPHIEQYVRVKRASGRKFTCEVRELLLFDRFVHQRRIRDVGEISTRHIEAYLVSRPRTRPRSYNHLLGAVRRLFRWLVVQGELDRSPVRQLPRRDISRRIPFIFAPEDARRLLACAEALPTKGGTLLRGMTYRTMFAVLYALGLRVGEACRLQCKDVDQKGSSSLSATRSLAKAASSLSAPMSAHCLPTISTAGFQARACRRQTHRCSHCAVGEPSIRAQ